MPESLCFVLTIGQEFVHASRKGPVLAANDFPKMFIRGHWVFETSIEFCGG